ncbi:MAG TPA: response regulator [Bacteroidota bacterium]|nr:response regulator [Bacteroidota bacterium]
MKRVFVVDDEDFMRESIVQVLRLAEYEVDEAQNGREALARLASFNPDLIISDVNMPELDGFGLLKELRKSERTADIPFIFLTGAIDRSSQREGMLLGADDYITKPFEQDDLIKAVELRLSKHQLMQDNIKKRLDEFRKNINLSLPHEFRTPLTGILGFAEILQETRDLSADETVHIGLHIHKSATRLHKLLERMLLLSELDSIVASPERKKVFSGPFPNIGPIIGRVVENEGLETQRKDDILVSIVEARVSVLESHLQKVIEEILTNALKFSHKGSKVNIATSLESGRVSIFVEDHGKGMSAEQIGNIGAFVQFDRKRNEQQGAGIGLALVRKICDLYGGSLMVDRSEAGGTKVTLTFPTAE